MMGLDRLDGNKLGAALKLSRFASNKRPRIKCPRLGFWHRTDDSVERTLRLRLNRTPHIYPLVKKGDIDRVHAPLGRFARRFVNPLLEA